MRSNLLICVLLMALSASADKAHEVFNANREAVLSSGVSKFDGIVYVFGKASSPRNRGDSVGWTKAEENAKWNLGDQHRASAPWPADVSEDEKTEAWLEYRSGHPERFQAVGLQRIWTQKTPPDNYSVVLSVPAEFVDLAPPSSSELASAVTRVREKRRLKEEVARKAREEIARKAREEAERQKAEKEAAERKAGARKVMPDGTVRQMQLDEDMVL